MLQKPNFWYEHCEKEIPSETKFDLLDNIFPGHWKYQSKVDWQKIYKCWYGLHFYYKAPTTVLKLVSGLNGISSIKVSG